MRITPRVAKIELAIVPGHAGAANDRTEARMTLRSILARLLGPWVFDTAAWLYDWMTANPAWQESCAHLLSPAPDGAGARWVLDLGIGPGVSAIQMGASRPQARFVGLDLSHVMLKQARLGRGHAGWPPNRLMLVQADVAHLPLAGQSFDAAAAHSFLYLLPDPDAALVEANRVMRAGGLAAFMEPSSDRVDWGWLLRQRSGRLLVAFTLWRLYNWVHGRFSPARFKAAFERAGFSEVDTERTLGGFGLYGWARKR